LHDVVAASVSQSVCHLGRHEILTVLLATRAECRESLRALRSKDGQEEEQEHEVLPGNDSNSEGTPADTEAKRGQHGLGIASEREPELESTDEHDESEMGEGIAVGEDSEAEMEKDQAPRGGPSDSEVQM